MASTNVPLSVRVLRTFNPLISGLLRTPLQRWLGGDLLVLTYHGRKSGTEYTKPLAYVEYQGDVYLVARKKMSDWWRNLCDGTRVRVRYRGRVRDATCSVVDARDPQALARFREFLTRNPGTAPIVYDVRVTSDKKPKEEDLVARLPEAAIVRLTFAS